MTTRILRAASGYAFLFLLIPRGFSQQTPQRNDTAPLYRVTVVERTVKAINYQYRSGPTKIDFRGTVLLSKAKGDATVESRRGSTVIDAKMHGLVAPQRFGREYLTYVLWAITPEGRPYNIGELVADSSDKAEIHASSDLQAFALIVTAEPYSAVRQPSDVVVLENEVRPDTAGDIEPVTAKYDLLPRGEYTWHVPGDQDAAANGPKIPFHDYEAVSELYQAQNAVGIAGSVDAERYAPETLDKARLLLSQAEQLRDQKGDFRLVVQRAREAAQTAEDARVIAEKRRAEEQLSSANAELSKTQAALENARRAKDEALDQARQAQAEAAQQRAKEAEEIPSVPPPAPPVRTATPPPPPPGPDLTREARSRMLQQLKDVLPTLDTPRGLIATVPNDAFRGTDLRDAPSAQVAAVAAIVSGRPGLRVAVEGSSARAGSVRRILNTHGVAANAVSAAGRGQSSGVEIVISGDLIGRMALWDHSYSLTDSSQRWPR